jgi:hypothetical protein
MMIIPGSVVIVEGKLPGLDVNTGIDFVIMVYKME